MCILVKSHNGTVTSPFPMLHGSAAEELYKLQGGIGKDKLEMSRKEMWVDGI